MESDIRVEERMASPKIKVVDFFCGAGGLAYGLKEAGLTIAAGVDLDPACQYPFETNCGGIFEARDVASIAAGDLNMWFEGADYRVLAGCAPCQPFSTYSQKRKSPDERWQLLRAFLRAAVAVRPEIVTMENVRGLADKPIWTEFVSGLTNAGYHVSWKKVDCTKYGVPQSRHRLVLIASTMGPIELPTPNPAAQAPTVRQSIESLVAIKAGETATNDPMHSASSLSEINMRRIKASKQGGTWRDWPIALRSPCHRKKTGETYPAVYGRMKWDDVSPTITTQFYGFGNGRFGHPEQNRAISLREAAILQSFPPEYKFVPDGEQPSFRSVGILIGNAVPPKLGVAIGDAIIKHVHHAAGLAL